MFFFKICCVCLYVRSARTVAVRHVARARAVYVCATRARAKTARVRTVRARCTYRVREPYSRTVRKKCVPNFAVLFSKSDVFCFQNLLRVFFNPAVFFSHVRSAHMVVVRYGTRAHVRAARTRARVRCTSHARGVRVRSAQCACMARVRLCPLRSQRVQLLMLLHPASGHWACFAFSITRNTRLIDSNVRTRRFFTSIHLRARAAPDAGVGVPKKGFGRFSEIR